MSSRTLLSLFLSIKFRGGFEGVWKGYDVYTFNTCIKVPAITYVNDFGTNSC